MVSHCACRSTVTRDGQDVKREDTDGLSCCPDRKPHQRDQRDQTNPSDDERLPYAALEAAFSKSS